MERRRTGRVKIKEKKEKNEWDNINNGNYKLKQTYMKLKNLNKINE